MLLSNPVKIRLANMTYADYLKIQVILMDRPISEGVFNRLKLDREYLVMCSAQNRPLLIWSMAYPKSAAAQRATTINYRTVRKIFDL